MMRPEPKGDVMRVAARGTARSTNSATAMILKASSTYWPIKAVLLEPAVADAGVPGQHQIKERPMATRPWSARLKPNSSHSFTA